MITTILLLVIIVLAVICFLYVFSTQRKLVRLEEMMKNALSQITVQMKTRWDAVTSLVGMTKQYSAHEHDTLMEVIRARRSGTVETADEVNKQNEVLETIVGRLTVVAEQYPNLKADSVFLNTMNGIQGFEENVRVSRMVYNDSVTKMNMMVRQWPSSIVAGMLHFTLKNYIEEDKKRSEAPDVAQIFNGGVPPSRA